MKKLRTEDEEKIFYHSALKQLPRVSLTEGTGELLSELFEIKPGKRLIVYARNWLHKFPNHHDAPRIVAFWLKEDPSKKVYDLAAWYLEQQEPVGGMHRLISAVLRGKGTARLDRLIAERLEKDPHDDIWTACLDAYKTRSVLANRLALRWLKLNEDNPDLLIMGFTFFADSPEVVAAVFNHFRKHGCSRKYNEMEIRALLWKAREFQMPILPKVPNLLDNG